MQVAERFVLSMSPRSPKNSRGAIRHISIVLSLPDSFFMTDTKPISTMYTVSASSPSEMMVSPSS